MSLLKRENWFLYVFLTFITCGAFSFVIASDLKLYEKDAWYSKWYYWVLGTVLFVYPALVMLIVFNVQMQIKICRALEVPGDRYYKYPYLWILSLIVPILGWSTFLVMLLHVYYYPAVMIYKGNGEKLCKQD
jgi:uncharacterized membrane protein YhaH (DUF805 family)